VGLYDDAINRSRHDDRPWQRENLEGALSAKGALLIELNRPKDALRIFSELIAIFQDEQEHPLIAHIVAVARDTRDQLINDGD
jgi:hypothetical protein